MEALRQGEGSMPSLSVERIAMPGKAGASSSGPRISMRYAVAFSLVGILGQFEASAQEPAVSAALADVDSKVTSEDLAGRAPADVITEWRVPPKRVTSGDVASKATGASKIMEGRVGVDLTPGSDQAAMDAAQPGDALYINQMAEREEAARIDDDRPFYQTFIAAIDRGHWGSIILVLGLGLFGYVIVRRPLRQFRMGQHLTRMTNVIEAMERTRNTMPIGAGGGIDSLPADAQRRADAIFEQGLAHLRSYPRHEVTRELVKNARLADAMGRSMRVLAINRLIESLSQSGIALGLDDFAKSYA